MYLLYTDTIIYSLKGSETVKQHLQLHINDAMSVSSISLMELYYGAYKSQKVAANLAKVRAIEAAFEIVTPGIEATEIFGMLKAQLESSGTLLADMDLIIAACALGRNLTLVTNNIRHFSRIDGLKLENWSQ